MSEQSQAGEQPTIEIDWSDEPPVVYANGAQILNSQREFALLFTDFVAFAGRGNTPVDQPPKAKLVSNLRLTPDVFFQLAAAAASNWNKYVQRFGDPSGQSPKFLLLNGGGQLEGLEQRDLAGLVASLSNQAPNQAPPNQAPSEQPASNEPSPTKP